MIFRRATVNEWGQRAYQNSRDHGFYDDNGERNFGEVIALMHSELSEALEEYRDGRNVASNYYKRDEAGLDKPEGVAVELVDCVIRILDTLTAHGVDIEFVIEQKMRYNEKRPYKHGKRY